MLILQRFSKAFGISDGLVYLILAAAVVAGLSLVSLRSGAEVLAAEGAEILVRDVNVRNDPGRQEDPEDEFSLEFTNAEAYEAAEAPRVIVESFVFVENEGEGSAS